ncbi:MAG: hypothetical protein ACOCZS_02705 [Verrucomicrobiota bacterium]
MNNILTDIFLPAEVKMRNGRATLMVENQAVPPMAFASTPRQNSDFARRWSALGFNLHFINCESGWADPESHLAMIEEGKTILESNPSAILMVRVHCEPPPEWVDKHPEELLTDETGETNLFFGGKSLLYGKRAVCPLSDAYVEQSGLHLEALLETLADSPIAHRVCGFFLLGKPHEWYISTAFDGERTALGFSKAFKLRYGQWLQSKYGTEEALREAWKNSTATFTNPQIPPLSGRIFAPCRIPSHSVPELTEQVMRYVNVGLSPHERLHFKGDWGSFANPAMRRCELDFYEAWSAGMCMSMERLAKVIKLKTGGSVVVGGVGGQFTSTYYHHSGTSAPENLIESKYLDFICAVSAYEDRVPGGAPTFRGPTDSFAFNGKLWFNECDTRTCYSQPRNQRIMFGGGHTPEESVNILKRDFAHILCEDVQAWWYDFAAGEASYYDHDAVREVFQKQQKIAADAYNNNPGKISEIAIVYHQDSIWSCDPETLRDILWLNKVFEIPRTGAPCDHIMLSDLQVKTLPRYKLYVFANCFCLDNSERELIDRTLTVSGATAVWLYAPGILRPDGDKNIDIANTEALTGFKLDVGKHAMEGTFRISSPGSEKTAGISPQADLGRYNRPLMNGFGWQEGRIKNVPPSLLDPPVFVTDPDAVELGRFVNNGQTAWAMKENGNFTSIYLGVKVLNSCVLRALARLAGVHVYSDSDDVFFASKHYLAIHASEEGQKYLYLPCERCNLREVYTDQTFRADSTGTVTLNMQFGQTMMFKMERV